jgi:hypothetical protein
VIGVSPSVMQIDLKGSLANSPLDQLLACDHPSSEDQSGERSGTLQVIDDGRFFSDLNHFQDCEHRNGDNVMSKRLPQHRSNVVLLFSNENGGASHHSNTLYNFSMPFWSFLHGHPPTDGVLPTENSEILDSPPQKSHSLFTELCNFMMFLLRKLTCAREQDLIREVHSSAEEGGGQATSSALLEPVAATLKVLLALENKVR